MARSYTLNSEFVVAPVETSSIEIPISTNERLQKIEETQKRMKNDISIILENQAKMLALLTQYSKKNIGAIPIFPIKTIEGIKKADDSIRGSVDSYVSIIRDIIFPDGLKENFHRLFDTEFIINYNFDGVNTKDSLKEYKHLMEAIFEAMQKDGYTYKEFKSDMRHAIKLAKNRHFKRVYDMKKKNSC